MNDNDVKLILDKLDGHTKNINLILVNSTEIKTIQLQHVKEITDLNDNIKVLKKDVVIVEKDIVDIKNNLTYYKEVIKELKKEEINIKSRVEKIDRVQTTNQPVVDNQKKLNWLFLAVTITSVIGFIFKMLFSLYSK